MLNARGCADVCFIKAFETTLNGCYTNLAKLNPEHWRRMTLEVCSADVRILLTHEHAA